MIRLTRRDFLKLCGTSSVGLVLSACGVTPTSTVTPVPANTALPTGIPLSTNTLLSTATATLTSTPAPMRTATAISTRTPTPIIPQIKITPDQKLVNEKGEILKGSIIVEFLYPYTGITSKRLAAARTSLRINSLMGVNAISIVLNASLFDDTTYLQDVQSVLLEARQLGLATILSIHSDGVVLNPDGTFKAVQQLTAVDASLKDKWTKLLKNPTYGQTFVKNTNAFVLLEEAGPTQDSNRKIIRRDLDWRQDMQFYVEAVKAIRELTGEDTPCSLSGGYWGRTYDDLLQMGKAPLKNLLLNIDPAFTIKPGGEEALDQISAMRALNYTPFFGELGWIELHGGDTIDDVKRRLEIAQRDGLAYFFWELNQWQDLQDLFSTHNPDAFQPPAVDESKSLVIYDDQLARGWINRSWDSTIDLAFDQVKYTGENSIKVSPKIAPNTWGALSLAAPLSVSTYPYGWLEFYVNGGNEVPRQLQVFFYGGTWEQMTPPVRINQFYIEGGVWRPNQWHRIRIPLYMMGAYKTAILSLAIQDSTGKGQSPFYVDKIRLVGVTTP
jgi:hypothetical protein